MKPKNVHSAAKFMLTRDQIDHFETFGFLMLRRIFTPQETETLIRETEAVYGDILGHAPREDEVVWESGFIERSPVLSKLAEDDRIYGTIRDLLNDDFIWAGSEGMRGVDRGGPVHHWHSDGDRSTEKLHFTRIKLMLYLDPLTRDTGALRVIPGSHRSPLHEALMPFQDAHATRHPMFFGLEGPDVPAYAVETEPGDMVVFNQWLFHSVYGQAGARRTIVLKFTARPTTDAALAILKQSPNVFTPHEAFLNSDRPRIQQMIEGLSDLGKRAAAL